MPRRQASFHIKFHKHDTRIVPSAMTGLVGPDARISIEMLVKIPGRRSIVKSFRKRH